FASIPWPMADAPESVADLQPAFIKHFVASDVHSAGVAQRDRIRDGLRRWHPDKFARILSRVQESDRAAVKEGVLIVTRCLNEMLER
ncbi:hypothetical protein BV25DRAFT_1783438, partial [Artomyces pyxidatus]